MWPRAQPQYKGHKEKHPHEHSLLDAVLYRDDVPPVFMLLNEDEQLRAGNAFMRRLPQQMNPANPVLGQRQVINLVDAGESLSERFGVDLTSLLPKGNPAGTFTRKTRTLAELKA